MMNKAKTRSLEAIEERMESVDKGSLRYQILDRAKQFKSSWIDLGQALYTVWKDKLYREWGHQTFEAYTAREIGIKKPTALKLLRSYYFLEKEEPGVLRKSGGEPGEVSSIPSYESVNVLRLAKNNNSLTEHDYAAIKKEVIEKGKDANEVRRDITALMRQREEEAPEEARRKRRVIAVKRLVSVLKSLKRELEFSKCVPESVINDTGALIQKIEKEMGG